MHLFDTHCHLDDEQFDDSRDAVVDRAQQAGVETIVAVGTTLASSRACCNLSDRYPCVHSAVGIHPNYCQEAEVADWGEIVKLCDHDKVVAVGETGLDRHWDYTPFDVQQDYFDRHIRLAQQRDLPFIVHVRDCEEDVLQILRRAIKRGPLRGIMHSFTGTQATADECLELGLHVSFAGMVTFKKSDELRRIATTIPAERLLLETDAPYLSPHPCRGQRPNEPALIEHTANCLADVRSMPRDALAESTTHNARTLFRT